MSRNLEILQRVEGATARAPEPEAASEQVLGTRLVLANPPAIPRDGRRTALDVDKLLREELCKVAQRLFLLPGSFKAVVFSGVGEENGCGRVCAQIGEILDSQAPRSVCLVDANFPAPYLHEYFDISNDGGLTDAVLHPGPVTDFARRVRGANLWVVPAGTIGSEWPNLVNSGRMRLRIHELCELYDHVLINAPACGVFADAMHLGKLVDGIVVVLRANATRREAARKVKQDMEAANVRLLGAVLNDRTFPIPDAIYSRL